MYYEVNLIEAIMAHHKGKEGIVLQKNSLLTNSPVARTFAELFDGMKDMRFLIDDTDLERTKDDPVPAVEIPEAKMEIETPEKPKRKYGRMTDAERETAKQKILKAWAGGDHTIQQICEMTGYNYRTVRQYIPVTVNG